MDELTVKNDSLTAVIGSKGIEEVIKPLVREIHLFDTFVAGTSHLKDLSVLDEIREGDRLILQREDNRFDDNAIIILTEAKKKVGYVPEQDNTIFARLMDAGKLLTARIKTIEKKKSYSLISIGIYLTDI